LAGDDTLPYLTSCTAPACDPLLRIYSKKTEGRKEKVNRRKKNKRGRRQENKREELNLASREEGGAQ